MLNGATARLSSKRTFLQNQSFRRHRRRRRRLPPRSAVPTRRRAPPARRLPTLSYIRPQFRTLAREVAFLKGARNTARARSATAATAEEAEAATREQAQRKKAGTENGEAAVAAARGVAKMHNRARRGNEADELPL